MKRSDFFKGSAAALGALALRRDMKATPLRRLLEDAGGKGDDALWPIVHDQFILDPEWTYLNFGGLGAMPLPVINSYEEWSRIEERSPTAGHDDTRWNSVKEKLAGLLGKTCRADDLALISSATEGVNMIINGLPLKKGDEVISSTHEHVALKSALLNRKGRDGIVIRTFDPDLKNGRGNVDRIAGLVNSRTRLIFLSHVTCTFGQQFPIKDIAALAREKGIWFALDGAQGPACVSFDLGESGVDFYASSTHKWMMGPKRTGFLYVKPDRLDVLQPLTVGAGSSKFVDLASGELALLPTVQRFEYGTQNEALFFALGTAIDFIDAIGLERVLSYSHGLAEKFLAGLKEIPGVEILSPAEESRRSSMISFRMAQQDLWAVSKRLQEDHIRVRLVTENRLDCFRVSFFINNRTEDVDRILTTLKKQSCRKSR